MFVRVTRRSFGFRFASSSCPSRSNPDLDSVCSANKFARSLPLYQDSHSLRSSPRPISNSPLHTLLHFHSCPINLIVSQGSYLLIATGYLILGGASRLDAFSVYPGQTWLLCHALGSATDTPAVRPPRSSRTKGSSPQISYAHAG